MSCETLEDAIQEVANIYFHGDTTRVSQHEYTHVTGDMIDLHERLADETVVSEPVLATYRPRLRKLEIHNHPDP